MTSDEVEISVSWKVIMYQSGKVRVGLLVWDGGSIYYANIHVFLCDVIKVLDITCAIFYGANVHITNDLVPTALSMFIVK